MCIDLQVVSWCIGHSLLSRLSESNIQLATSMDAKPAVVHVRSILDDMAEKFSQAQAAGMARANMLEQCLQLRDYETNVAQVLLVVECK